MTTREAEAVRPNFAEYAHEQNLRGDKRFKAAMLNARRWKRENIMLGVHTKPCTDFPRFIAHGDSKNPLILFAT